MKRLMKAAWILAASALAFSSCVEEQALAPQDEQAGKISVNITAGSAETKTHLDGTNQIKWDSANEKIELLEKAGSSFSHVTSAAGTIADNGLTAKFTATLDPVTGSSFDYYAVYPSTNFVEKDNKTVAKMKLELPAEQHPTATSFDPKADLLVSKGIHLTEQAKDLSFEFARPIAIMEMTVKGLEANEKIQSVEFSSETAVLSGRMYYDFTADKVVEYGYYGQKMVNCKYDKVNYQTNPQGNKIYFTVLPTDITDFTVKVTTDKATYTKTVKPEIALTINPNKLVKFSVAKLDRIESKTDKYTLLTNASLLTEGDQIIIESSGFALGYTPTGEKYRANVNVEINSDNTITTIADGIKVLTLESGEAKGTFKLKDDTGYLTHSGTGNTLTTANVAADAISWTIAIKDNITTISKVGIESSASVTRYIKYNSQNPRFAAYKSGQVNIQIFYKQSKEALSQPTYVKAVPSGNTLTVTWNPVEGAASYTVSCGDKSLDVTDGSNTANFKDLLWETAYKITVTAHPTDTANYRDSKSDAIEATTEANESATPIDTPTGLTATVTGNKVALTWTAVTDAKTYTIICGEKEITVSTPSAEVTGLPWNSTQTISVVAYPDPTDATLSSSDAAIITVSILEKPNIAFLTEEDLTTSASNSYGSLVTITAADGNVWKHTGYVDSQHYPCIQMRMQNVSKSKNKPGGIITLPTFKSDIKSIKFFVTDAKSTSYEEGGAPTSGALNFQLNNTDSKEEPAILSTPPAEGTTKELVMDFTGKSYKTGFIRATAGFRIWRIEVTL